MLHVDLFHWLDIGPHRISLIKKVKVRHQFTLSSSETEKTHHLQRFAWAEFHVHVVSMQMRVLANRSLSTACTAGKPLARGPGKVMATLTLLIWYGIILINTIQYQNIPNYTIPYHTHTAGKPLARGLGKVMATLTLLIWYGIILIHTIQYQNIPYCTIPTHCMHCGQAIGKGSG